MYLLWRLVVPNLPDCTVSVGVAMSTYAQRRGRDHPRYIKNYKPKGSIMKRLIALLLSWTLLISLSSAESKTPSNISLQLDTQGHTAMINDVIATKSSDIITASDDKTIRVWSSVTGKEKRKILGEIGIGIEGSIAAIALSPNEKFLASAVVGYFDSYHIRIYNYSTGTLLKVLKSEDRVRDLSFSKDNKYLISGSIYRTARIWSTQEFELSYTIDFGFSDWLKLGYIREARILTKNKKHFAIIVTARGIILSDIEKVKVIRTLDEDDWCIEKDDDFNSLAVSKKYIAVSGYPNKIKIYNHSLNYIQTITSENNPIGLAYSADGRFLIAGKNSDSDYGFVNIYNVNENYKKTTSFKKHKDSTYAVSFLNNKTAISAGGHNNEIYIWDIESAKVKTKIEGAGAGVLSVGVKGESVGWGNELNYRNDNNRGSLQKILNLKTMNIDSNKSKLKSMKRVATKKGSYSVTHPIEYNDRLFIMQNGQVTRSVGRYDNDHNCYSFYKNYIISGGTRLINIYNLDDKKIAELVGHTGVVSSIALDGDRLVSGSSDQIIRVWDLSQVKNVEGKAKKLASQLNIFVSKTNQHIAWTNEGYFTASENATQYLYFHINQGSEKEAKAIPMKRLYDHFFRPDLIQLKLSGDEEAYQKAIKGMSYQKALSNPPPKVNLLKANEQSIVKADFKYSDISTTQPKAKLTFDIKDEKGGIGLIRVYQEGKLIQTIGEGKDNRKVADVYNTTVENKLDSELKVRQEKIRLASKGNGDSISEEQPKQQNTTNTNSINQEGNQTIEATLQSGDNQLCVEAFNKTNTVTSYRECVTIHANIPKEKPKLYGLVVGVNRFTQHPVSNLRYSQKDAKDIKKIIEKQNSGIYESIEIEQLLGKKVSQKNILDRLKAIKEKASIDDTIIFYISTHGTVPDNKDNNVSNRELYLYAQNGNSSNPFISFQNLFKAIQSIPSLKQIMIVDACQSGQASDMVSSIYDSRASVLAKSAGIHLLLATTKGTSAFESQDPKIKNGVFTHQILTALKAKETDSNKDNSISIIELSERLKAQAHKTEAQYPIIRNVGGDVGVMGVE